MYKESMPPRSWWSLQGSEKPGSLHSAHNIPECDGAWAKDLFLSLL